MSNSAFEDIMEKLKNPDNLLTDADRNKIRQVAGNVENTLKASLINLLLGRFSKVSVYDSAIQSAITLLSDRARTMTDEDLIAFLSALTKVSATESKNIMDLFKKNDTDLKQFLREIQKLSYQRPAYREDSDDIIEGTTQEDANLKKMSPEKKEKLLQLLRKMEGAKVVEVEQKDDKN